MVYCYRKEKIQAGRRDICEIIGAFLAEELTRAGVYSRNAHQTIYIVTPKYSASGQMLFRDNYLNKALMGMPVTLLAALKIAFTPLMDAP